MLQTCRHIVHSQVVKVFSLQAACQLGSHDTIQQHILSETFPHSRPKRRTGDIHHRRINPRNEAGPCLVGSYLSYSTRNGRIETGTLSHFLRKECRAPSIAGTMYLVDTINFRYATLLKGSKVEGADDVRPLLGRLGSPKRDIQNGAHLVLAKYIVHCIGRKQSSC